MKTFTAAVLLAIVAGTGSASADWKLGQRPTMDEREQYETYHLRKGGHEGTNARDTSRASPRDAYGRMPAAQPSIHPDFFDYERSNGRS